MVDQKRCSKCGAAKPITAFSRDNRRDHQGLTSQCKRCRNAHKRAYKAKNRAKVNAYNRRYYAEHREQAYRQHQKWKAEHPLARAAHHAVYYAIRTGRLVSPDTCDRCGQMLDGRLHCHHSNYTRRLSVTTLCLSCHQLIHLKGSPDG